MTRARGRPAVGAGVTRDDIVAAALALLDEDGEAGLAMRAVAARLGVTPMSLYRHVADRSGLLRALAERVYGEVLDDSGAADSHAQLRALLGRYHDAVGRHPQLTLALFAEPDALAGVTGAITARLTALLQAITPEHLLWRDILVDHAHGSGMALAAARGDARQADAMRTQYRQALDCLLARLEER